MADKEEKLVLKVEGENEYVQGVQNAKKETEALGETLEKTNKKVEKSEKSLGHAGSFYDGYAKIIGKLENGLKGLGLVEDKFDLGKDLKDKAVSKGIEAAEAALKAVKETMYDVSDASASLAAKTGLSETAAKRYEEVMKQIRGDNFGESYRDVADAMSEVIQIMGELDEADMTAVTESALTLKDVFGMDVNESIQAVSAMMTTMGVDAAAAFDLITAGAQKGLNCSGDLTDKLTEYASLWGQAGFSAEEMFTVLENGLDAGAGDLDNVNSYVQEFGASMADGRIEKNLDSFSDGTKNLFQEWQNGNASVRDVFYSVIDDLEHMEDRQEAITAAGAVWGSAGEGNAMQVLTALNDLNGGYQNVKGSMESLQEVEYSDLESAVSGLNTALQDNLITPIAETVAPLLTTVFEGATAALNGVGEALTPQKTELDVFVEDIQSANEELKTSMENAEATMENGELEAERIGILGTQLLSLNDVENKSLAQKYQLREVVSELGKTIPEIAAAYDEEAGKVNLSNESIRKLIDNTRELMIAQAAQNALQEVTNQLMESKVALSEAEIAKGAIEDKLDMYREEQRLLTDLADQYNKYENSGEYDPTTVADIERQYLEFWNKQLNNGRATIEEYNKALERAGAGQLWDRQQENAKELENLNDALEKVTGNTEELGKECGEAETQAAEYADIVKKTACAMLEENEAVAENSTALDENVNQQEQLQGKKAETAEASRENTEALEEESEALEDTAQAAAAVKAGAEAQKEAYRSVLEEYQSMTEAIEADIQNKINPFDKFDGGADVTVEDMKANLENQKAAMEEYKANLAAVTEALGDDENAGEFLQYIQQMGLDGANMLRNMAETLDEDGGVERLKELAGEYAEAMDASEEIASAQAANELALKASMGELGSSEEEFDDLGEIIHTAIADAVADSDSAWYGISEGTANALDEAAAVAQECGVQIPEGLAAGIASGTITPEEAIAQLNGGVEGSLNGLLEIARENGIEISDNVIEGIAAGGQGAVDAYKELISLLAAQRAEAETVGEESGAAAADTFASGIENGAEGASSAGSTLAGSAASGAGENQSAFGTAGNTAAAQYAAGIGASAYGAVEAAGNMASRAVSAAKAWENTLYTTGYKMTQSLASGISNNSHLVRDAVTRVVQNARIAADEEAEKGVVQKLLDGEKENVQEKKGIREAVRSSVRDALGAAGEAPELKAISGRFRRAVGRKISSGVAFGIRDNASLAGREAARMSNTVYTRAVSWMNQYKRGHRTSLEDEVYYWKEVLKHVKKGTSAYNRAMGNLDRVRARQVGGRELLQQINSNFGVSRTRQEGNSTRRLNDADYYGEVYSAAQRYMRNYQVLHDVSLEKQRAYWQNVRDNLKRGTQAWYDATGQINDLEAEIERQQQNRLAERADVQQSILDHYKIYYRVSARAEMQYWNAARRQFRAGTEERSAADQRYLEAQQEYYDQRRKLDEDYAEDSQKINDRLADDVEELQEAYRDAVKDRREDILSQMDLFDAWDSSGYDGDTLLYNLRTQVAGLALWEQQLNELSGKNISADLLEELREMGPQAAASIYSLNQMTAAELAEYNRLWNQRNELAESQAVRENEGLRQETNQQIAQLRAEARAELSALNAEYRSALDELNTGMGAGLRNLLNRAGSIGEDAVAGLIAGIGRAADSVETYRSTTQVTNRLTSQLSHLSQEGNIIGSNTLNNILTGLSNKKKIESSSREIVRSIQRALEDASGGMYAKAFQKAAGGQALFLEETKLPDYAGADRLNRMLEGYRQHQPVVEVNNDALAALLGTLVTAVDGLSSKLDDRQVVMDTGALVAAIQPAMSREMAAVTVRRNGGRIR